MRPHLRRTTLLAVAAAALLLVDLAAHRLGPPGEAELPSLTAIDPGDAARIRLTQGEQTVLLERRDGGWRLAGPEEHAADQALVQAILYTLRRGVTMDVLVDRGELERYGLESPAAIRVEIEGESASLVDFYIGNNSAGGSSFVRLPDSDEVYRARVGGRHRYARPARAWRDHMVLGQLSAQTIAAVHIHTDEGSMSLERAVSPGERGPVAGAWSAGEDWPVDQASADALADKLASLRAGEILPPGHPAGLEAPLARIEVDTLSGGTHRLVVGRTEDGDFVSRGEDPEVFRVGPGLAQAVLRPRAAWRDRSLLSFTRPEVHTMALVEPMLTTVLEQDPADSSWRVTAPANVTADLRQSITTARTLGRLRAEDIVALSSAEAGFPSSIRIEITLLDGRQQVLEIGDAVAGREPGDEAVYVRTAAAPERVGVLPSSTLSELRRAWAR